MKIREVLEADFNTNKIDVTIRDNNSRFVMRYYIGKPIPKALRFHFLWEKGECTMYEIQKGLKMLYIERNIQEFTREKPHKGFPTRGVILKAIPKELLELEVEFMHPVHEGSSSDLHGYSFECYTDTWSGIPEEFEQEEMEM